MRKRFILIRMQTTQSTSVSAKIRGIAAEHRATQEDIAKIAGISRTAVVRRLNGSTDWQATELMALAAAFNVAAGAFFPPVDSVTPNTESAGAFHAPETRAS